MEVDDILTELDSGKISVGDAKKLLSLYSIEKVGEFAKIDTGRRKRRGIPEVVFAETKQLSEIKGIISAMVEKSGPVVVVSRIKRGHEGKVREHAAGLDCKIRRGKNCSTIAIYKRPVKRSGGRVGILAAGTSDIGIAEESRLMAESMGCECVASYDVGVAGIHRVMPVLKEFVKNDVDAVVVVAGMEGALATVVASLVGIPVIGVPTSVGYGYGEGGVAALASMLQSCSLGLSVVNIDNGIAAGAIAANIANRAQDKIPKNNRTRSARSAGSSGLRQIPPNGSRK